MSKDNQGEPDTPLQPVKDEGYKIALEKIRDLKEFGFQSTVVKEMKEIAKEALSSPPEPSSKEQEGGCTVVFAELCIVFGLKFDGLKQQWKDGTGQVVTRQQVFDFINPKIQELKNQNHE